MLLKAPSLWSLRGSNFPSNRLVLSYGRNIPISNMHTIRIRFAPGDTEKTLDVHSVTSIIVGCTLIDV